MAYRRTKVRAVSRRRSSNTGYGRVRRPARRASAPRRNNRSRGSARSGGVMRLELFVNNGSAATPALPQMMTAVPKKTVF